MDVGILLQGSMILSLNSNGWTKANLATLLKDGKICLGLFWYMLTGSHAHTEMYSSAHVYDKRQWRMGKFSLTAWTGNKRQTEGKMVKERVGL